MTVQAQTAVETSRLYHDLNSLSKLRGQIDDGIAVKEAAKQFESMFYSMMLKSMRDASKAINPNPMFDSPSMDLYTDMYDKQLSLEFGTSSEGALGLADILVNQLTRTQSPPDSNYTSLPIDIPGSSVVPNQAVISNESQRVATDKAQPEELLVDEITPKQVQSVPVGDKQATDVADKGIDYSSPSAFVSSLLPYAQKFAQKLNMDPKVLLAQAALETGWGKYVMRTADGMTSNNLFGIKADQNWQGEQSQMQTLEFEAGQLQQKVASFKAYPDPKQAFADYVELISSKPRYDKALSASASAKQYLEQLQQAGYATDPNYAKKIYQIYRSDTLNQAFDAAENQTMRLEP